METFVVDILIGGIGLFGLFTFKDILREWAYRKMFDNKGLPSTKKDYVRTAMARRAELEEMQHQKTLIAAKAEIVIAETNLQVVERAAAFHIQRETNSFLALPTSNGARIGSIGDQPIPDFQSYQETAISQETPITQNGSARKR